MINQIYPELAVGFVGLGLIGHKRARSLPEKVSISWGVDPNKNARDNFRNQYRCDVFSKFDLDSLPKVDVIFISTTHQFLSEIACLSLSKGIHTFIEKPGAINYASILKIQKEYLLKKNVVLNFGFNHRFHPAFLEMKRYIVQNNLENKITTIRGTYGHGGRKGYESEWRMDPAKSGGGELLDQGSHLIDLCHYLTNKTYEIEYSNLRKVFWKSEVEDNINVFLKSEEGKIFANLTASWTEWKNNFLFEVFTKKIQFSVKGLGGSYGIESLTIYEMSEELGPPKTTIYEYPGLDTSWQKETLTFFENIKNNNYIETSLEDTIKLHAIVHNIYLKNKCSWLEAH